MLGYEDLENEFEQLANDFFPRNAKKTNEVINGLHFDKDEKYFEKYRWKRSASSCAGGKGRYGFNSYNLLTFTILSFNLAANLISNSNNNINNNNNNNNENDLGSVSSNSQDTDVNSNQMSMVMVTVPPVGPPVVVPIGRALFQNSFPLNKSLPLASRKVFQDDPLKHLQAPEIILDKRFDVPQNSFYLDVNEGMDDERRIFTNGTILYRKNNTLSEGTVYYGLSDFRNRKRIYPLSDLLPLFQQNDVKLSSNGQENKKLHENEISSSREQVKNKSSIHRQINNFRSNKIHSNTSRIPDYKEIVIDLDYLRQLNRRRIEKEL